MEKRKSTRELDNLIAKRGGLLFNAGNEEMPNLFDVTVARFNRHVVMAKEKLYEKAPRDIFFDFLCQTNFGAFAYSSCEPDQAPFDFIGINAGVPLTLVKTFNRILASKTTFLDVGQPELENPAIKPIAYLSTDVFSTDNEAVVPRCPVRAIYAGELTQVALDFIFFHELTHLRNGHLEFIKQRSVSNWMEAFESKAVNDSLLSQTLEFDADAGAMLLTLNQAYQHAYLLETKSREINKSIHDAMEALYGSEKKSVRTVNYAVYVMFRLFDKPEWKLQHQEKITHPLPSIRMWFAGLTVLELLKARDWYNYDADEFSQDHGKIMRSAEKDCAAIQDREPDAATIKGILLNQEWEVYLGNLKDCWQNIRPALEIHKRGGKLAP